MASVYTNAEVNQLLPPDDYDSEPTESRLNPHSLPLRVRQTLSHISIDLVSVYYNSIKRREFRKTRCFLMLLSFTLVAGLAVLQAYFVFLGMDELKNREKYCKQLAFWYYISGVGTLCCLGLIQISGLLCRGKEDSQETSTMAYLLYIFQFGWSIHGIKLLSLGNGAASTCVQLYWPLWYLFVVALPAIVGASCCIGCSILAVSPKIEAYEE
eukprot:gb/GEZN01016943.1/.p1 GENE.gb/GEZN01016943.1/~~gb/GEZN01016943.1/.p1  ORF type:complete len:212 (-),score=23.68 gb/GEZN01016943.1/:143-778(-)